MFKLNFNIPGSVEQSLNRIVEAVERAVDALEAYLAQQ